MKICLIPARANSKRIKNKNVKKFSGKPLINWSIQLAKKSKLFDDIVVSTDSKKITKIAKKAGASIPFLRPKKISGDYASDEDVLHHFLNYARKKKIKINFLCYLYPTVPLLKLAILKKCHDTITKSKYTKLMTVCSYRNPIQQAFKKNKSGEVQFVNKRYQHFFSYELPKYYYDAGQCYWYNIKNYLKEKNKDKIKMIAIELNRYEFQDINTIEDFRIAQKLFKMRKTPR